MVIEQKRSSWRQWVAMHSYLPDLADIEENDNEVDSQNIAFEDEDDEDFGCEVKLESAALRNGLGDDSFFVWPNGKIPVDPQHFCNESYFKEAHKRRVTFFLVS